MDGALQRSFVHFNNSGYNPSLVYHHAVGKSLTAEEYMRHFDRVQVGKVGQIFFDDCLRIEWYSISNGRCEIYLPVVSVDLRNGN